jgi:hypothetical protein
MRVLVLVILVAVATPARADSDVTGFFGLGFGPKAAIGGALGEQFQGANASGRLRLGFRAKRIGMELHFTAGGLDADGFTSANTVSYTPVVSAYLVKRRPLQLLVHGGMGFGAIGVTRTEQVPCELAEECGFKSEERSHSFHGVSLKGGVTAQLRLGGRRRGQHALLWVDLSAALLRHRVEDMTVSGHSRVLVIGVACAID